MKKLVSGITLTLLLLGMLSIVLTQSLLSVLVGPVRAEASEETLGIYNFIESLPAGSVVIISFDFGPATLSENYHQARACLFHCKQKELKVIGVAFWATGAPIGADAFREVYGENFETLSEYGTELVYIGYIPGGAVGMSTFADNTWMAISVDHFGNSFSDLPLMAEVVSAADFDLWVEVMSGTPGVEWVIMYVQTPHGGPAALPVGAGCTEATYGWIKPFYDSGQLVGILRGFQGALEYEVLLGMYICIRPDGLVEGTDKIQQDGDVYTFTDDIYNTIVVQRDNIVVDGAGYTVHGTGSGVGIYLSYRNNVTLENIEVTNFHSGIVLDSCSNNVLSGNTAHSNNEGISMRSSGNNVLSCNNASNNDGYGIVIASGNNNVITENIIASNVLPGEWGYGLLLSLSHNNLVHNNTIVNNGAYGIRLMNSGSNTLSHNNMSDNLYNFGVSVWGDSLAYFIQNIDTSNTINGKPIHYLINQHDITIDPTTFPNIGYLGVINSTNIVVKDLNMSNVGEAVLFAWTNNSAIENVQAPDDHYGFALAFSNSNVITENTAESLEYSGIMALSSNNNTLAGNTVSNGGFGIHLRSCSNNIFTGNNASNNYEGISLSSCSNNVLSGNTAANNNDDGIFLWDSSNNTLAGNTASNNDANGIHHSSSHNNTLSGNTAANNDQDGIFLCWNSSNNTLTSNTAYSNDRNGINLESCSNNVLSGNTASDNGNGIHLWDSSNNTLSVNAGFSNDDNGIGLGYSSSNMLINNTASNNKWNGIYLFESNNTEVTSNTLANNYHGIYLDSSSNNKFYHNSFIDNTQQVEITTPGYFNIWDDGYPSGGNYWSDYTGVDEKRGPNQDQHGCDGIGDTPYIIDANNTDYYPLINPWGVPRPRDVVLSLSGEHDYLYKEEVKIRVAALVTDAETMEPVSGANVTIEIYDPEGNLWISDNMSERLLGKGVYEWQSNKTIKQLMKEGQLHKGVYLVYVQASYHGGLTATAILEFHIDPPTELNTILLITIIGIVVGIIASGWYIDHRRLSRKLHESQETKH